MARDLQPDGGADVYGLAPDDPIGVSSATACTARLTKDKRRAVKSYVTTLGPALHQKHGGGHPYTPGQVRATALELALSIDYLCWGYLMYCSPGDFARIHEAAGEICDYDAMREVVAGEFFGHNLAFDAVEVAGAIVSGTAEAIASGAGEAVGWLADVDWSGLLDWS
jgi:hypothetical protein